MPRHHNEDFIKKWKISLPATKAGMVEHLLFDPTLSKPIYGARGKLIEILLDMWIDTVQGKPCRAMPSVSEVRHYIQE